MRYWKRLNPDGSTNAVESYSHHLDVKGAVEITEQEFNAFIASLPEVIPEPDRNLAAEVDDHEARIKELEKK